MSKRLIATWTRSCKLSSRRLFASRVSRLELFTSIFTPKLSQPKSHVQGSKATPFVNISQFSFIYSQLESLKQHCFNKLYLHSPCGYFDAMEPKPVNPRRRVLLIAIASWGVVAARARTANPITGLLGLIRLATDFVGNAAKIAIPAAKLPLKYSAKGIWFLVKRILRFRK